MSITQILPRGELAPLQQIVEPLFEQRGIRVYVKREDLIHPVISGNKWHKLRYNLMRAVQENYMTVISFGGAYSNHLHALAYAGKWAGLQTVGVVRGEAYVPLNPTLQFANDQGMILHYVDREVYRNKTNETFLDDLIAQYGRSYVIPEGGSNELAVKGCSEIVESISLPFDVICCACGTGGTFAGLISGLRDSQRALGFSVLKGGEFLEGDVSALLEKSPSKSSASWQIEYNYHFGGYAKTTPALKEFMRVFEVKHGIPIEPIYTGKMLYGLYDLVRRGFFQCEETIVVLHSGGLQGRTSALTRT